MYMTAKRRVTKATYGEGALHTVHCAAVNAGR